MSPQGVLLILAWLYLNTLHQSSSTLVPNEYIKTDKGEPTSLLTGVYYTLYNYGHNGNDRGGVVSYYFPPEAARSDWDGDLTYETLSLLKGRDVKPGGKKFTSTLFAFKKHKKFYQMYSKELQGVVSYRMHSTGEYRLVVYGSRTDAYEDIVGNGSLVGTTLFSFRKVEHNCYQLVSEVLKSVIDFAPSTVSFPIVNELRLVKQTGVSDRNRRIVSSKESGMFFRIEVAKIHHFSTLPSHHQIDLRSELNVKEKFVKNVLLQTANRGASPAKHLVTHSYSDLRTTVEIKEKERENYYIRILKTLLNTTVALTLSINVTTLKAGIEIGSDETRENVIVDNRESDEESVDDESETMFYIELNVLVEPWVNSEVSIVNKITTVKRDITIRNKVIITGDRLNDDGTISEELELDGDAIFTICKQQKFHEDLLIVNGSDGVYIENVKSISIEQMGEIEVVHTQSRP